MVAKMNKQINKNRWRAFTFFGTISTVIVSRKLWNTILLNREIKNQYRHRHRKTQAHAQHNIVVKKTAEL